MDEGVATTATKAPGRNNGVAPSRQRASLLSTPNTVPHGSSDAPHEGLARCRRGLPQTRDRLPGDRLMAATSLMLTG